MLSVIGRLGGFIGIVSDDEGVFDRPSSVGHTVLRRTLGGIIGVGHGGHSFLPEGRDGWVGNRTTTSPRTPCAASWRLPGPQTGNPIDRTPASRQDAKETPPWPRWSR